VDFGERTRLGLTSPPTGTAWTRGRFDARRAESQVLFGRMYEDAAIELKAFQPGGRVFCIASAGCTAMKLAPRHDVVAVDINPAQLAYARRRFAGDIGFSGTAERLMAVARAGAPLVGWWPSRLQRFLDFDDPDVQLPYWRRHLDNWRFRSAFDGLLSVTALGVVYARPFLEFLPRRLGVIMRHRMERCFARHPNRSNPYARALLLGDLGVEPTPAGAEHIRLVHADAAGYLEGEPAMSFDGFTLSNVLDGADRFYRRRLFAAVKRAARPGAMTVLRSFAEPAKVVAGNHAADDRAMLWGLVDVKAAAEL
jgi:S-adenosylmethionine:diacylglycerol 3-amino-3-carboxypropyl transferase